MTAQLESVRSDSARIERLKRKAMKRSGQIFLPCGARSWREAVTLHCGLVMFWYNTPRIPGLLDAMDTKVITEPLEGDIF